MISPEVLRRYPYFAGVSEGTLKAIAMISEARTFRAGDILFREEQPADHLYIVSEGEVDIEYVLGIDELQTVDTLISGDLMVWSALVPPHRTHSVATARSDVRLVAIEAAGLRELCDKDLLLGYRLMSGIAEAISHRLEGARLQLAAMT